MEISDRIFIETHLPLLAEVDIVAILSDLMEELDQFIVEKKTGTFIYTKNMSVELLAKIKQRMEPYVGC